MEKIPEDLPRERVFIGLDSLITEIRLNPYEKIKTTSCTPPQFEHQPSMIKNIAATSDGKCIFAASEKT
jgi:WD40 repeat protein